MVERLVLLEFVLVGARLHPPAHDSTVNAWQVQVEEGDDHPWGRLVVAPVVLPLPAAPVVAAPEAAAVASVATEAFPHQVAAYLHLVGLKLFELLSDLAPPAEELVQVVVQ